MKRKELGITEGEVHINDCFQTEVWSKNTKVASCKNGINSGIYRVKTDEEMKANANLIADAFNTANKCGLLPSELFQWKHETLMLLKEIANDTERRYRFTSGANWPKWYDKAINQIEQ